MRNPDINPEETRINPEATPRNPDGASGLRFPFRGNLAHAGVPRLGEKAMAERDPHQIVSTAEWPLPCIRCGCDLPPGHVSVCLACVEIVKAERARSTKHG